MAVDIKPARPELVEGYERIIKKIIKRAYDTRNSVQFKYIAHILRQASSLRQGFDGHLNLDPSKLS